MGDGTAAENEVSSSQTNNDGARQYSVSGLDDDEDYVLTLFPAEDVSIDDDGVVSFDDTEGTDNAGNGEADNQGNTNAEIEVVNGSTVADGTDEVVVSRSTARSTSRSTRPSLRLSVRFCSRTRMATTTWTWTRTTSPPKTSVWVAPRPGSRPRPQPVSLTSM